MIDREPTPEEITKVKSLLDKGEALLAMAEFSPGPWWGFNGVRLVVLTSKALRVYQRGVAVTARRDLAKTATRELPLSSIAEVKLRERQRIPGRPTVTMRLTTAEGRKVFTSKYVQGSKLAQALEEAIK
jgi:hypothetical protein